MARSNRGPFRPGPGGMPPHLAGREDEQLLLRDVLADLAEGMPPRAEIVLHGPRGNGKTVLLRWLEQEVAAFPPLEVVRLAAAEAPNEAALAGFVWRPGQGGVPPLRVILSARARKNPLVVLIDEAHTLDLELGRVLLNASQQVGRDLPFLLVLAGTPNLETHLNRMGASFWGRAEQLRIGRLDPGGTRAGFREPFANAGIEAADGALDEMIRLSQGYPYFIQLLGDAVWHAAHEAHAAPRRVERAGVDAGVPRFDAAKDAYYRNRFEELERRSLLAVGRAVADGFEGRDVLGFDELNASVRLALGDAPEHAQVVAARDALRDLGFIWLAGARPEWEPGIPSLMDYVREFAPAP